MKVISIHVTAVRPDVADTRQLNYLRTERNIAVEDHYYIVKLYLDQPLPVGAELLRLFVGGEEIMKYYGFSGGLFFKLYDPTFFEKNRDAPVFFSFGGVRFAPGATMPAKPLPQPHVRLLAIAGQPADSSLATGEGSQLPTKAEVLMR